MTQASARLGLPLLCLSLALPMMAAAQETKSLGGGAGTGKIMTRDELRACLKRQDDLAAQVAAFEADRKSHAAEKGDIVAAQEALKGQRGDVQADQAKVRELNERQRELGEKVEDWNRRMAEFVKEDKTGPFADRQRRNLKREKADLEREDKELAELRAGLGGESAAAGARAYNEQAEQQQARTVAWNKRNQELAERSVKLADEREFWAAECGSRRFAESDEIAIRQGK